MLNNRPAAQRTGVQLPAARDSTRVQPAAARRIEHPTRAAVRLESVVNLGVAAGQLQRFVSQRSENWRHPFRDQETPPREPRAFEATRRRCGREATDVGDDQGGLSKCLSTPPSCTAELPRRRPSQSNRARNAR